MIEPRYIDRDGTQRYLDDDSVVPEDDRNIELPDDDGGDGGTGDGSTGDEGSIPSGQYWGKKHHIKSTIPAEYLNQNTNLTIRIKDNNKGTYIGSKSISVGDIEEFSSSFDVEVDNSDNRYTLEFTRQSDGHPAPETVTYKIYQNVSSPKGDNRTLVAQFTIHSLVKDNGDFKYYYTIDEYKTDRISLDFNGKEEDTRYGADTNLRFSIDGNAVKDSLTKTISINYDDTVGEGQFDILSIKEAIKGSIDDNLTIEQSSADGSVSIINKRFTESERFLKYGVITDEGENLLVTNWVDGGNLNQVDDEIEPLGSMVLKLYDNASPLEIKDTVILSELYSNDIEVTVDLSEPEFGVTPDRLTPNFQKEVEENSISTFSEYQSFDELTLSGSSVQERIIDHFLQKKQEKVKLNTDFTNFNNFVKFSSAEERLVNFKYKVEELETYTSQSASLAESSASATFVKNQIEDINENIRTIKNSFDEYELFLFNDSGSLYENKPYVSASNGVFASWPKTTSTEEITNTTFSTTSSWDSNGTNGTEITASEAKIHKNGVVSQSLSLDSDDEYVLEFEVVENGVPLSFEYNGKTIVNETTLASGSNTFRFTTRNLQNSDNTFKIKGANYGETYAFTSIDSISVKKKPALKDSDSTEVTTWFSTLREVAKQYDARNVDSLRNNTPGYIRNDDQNSEYILFLDMIGQMFDGIWLYANELQNMYEWDNDISKGLSEDLSIVLLEAYGNNLDIGFSEKDVWEYVLGVDEDEDDLAKQVGFSFEKRQKETIRRLLVNLPYFLKHKGTERSIKGLVLSYGIPLSTLFIREYGTFQASDGLETVFSKEKETKKLRFNDGQITINQTGSYFTTSNAIEFNIQIPTYNSSTDVQLVNGGGFDVDIKSEGDGDGSVRLTIDDGTATFVVSSSAGPLYNNDFWNILVQQTDSGSYEVRAHQFNRDDGTFDYKLSGSAVAGTSISSSMDNEFLNNTQLTFNSFDGYMDEFRVWDTDISLSVFDEHVKFPTSVKLDDPLQIPDKLLARVDIDSENGKYVVEDDKIANLTFNPMYPAQLDATGFEVSDFETYTRTDFINSTNVGNEKLGNNKVRYNVTQSLEGNVLTPSTDDDLASNEHISEIEDSYKLTVGFSPTDITNEIILQHFGGNDLLDEFGDPLNKYEESYSGLEQTVESFFENISSNKKTKFFIEYIRNFDKTLFDNIGKFVPERADFSTSIFIEPHYLNRSKAKRLGQSQTEDLYNESNDVDGNYEVGSTYDEENNTENPLVTTNEETLVSDVLSVANPGEVITVISQDEVSYYLNQSTDVVILQDGFESQVIRNNVWEGDSSIKVTNKHGEEFRFKVYKFDYSEELQDLENQIGAHLDSNNLTGTDEEDQKYEDLTRLWDKYYELHDTLFLLDYDANPTDNAVLVTFEDLPAWLKEDLILSEGTTSANRTVNKNGITYTISDDTVDGGSVVETTTNTDTRTIVQDPDGDVKLTVE